MIKTKILNQIIEIDQSQTNIPYPYYDLNYSNNIIFVSAHISLTKKVDKDLINKIILKGAVDLLSTNFGALNNKTNLVLDWLVSNIDILKDCYIITEDGKKEFLSKEEDKKE